MPVFLEQGSSEVTNWHLLPDAWIFPPKVFEVFLFSDFWLFGTVLGHMGAFLHQQFQARNGNILVCSNSY